MNDCNFNSNPTGLLFVRAVEETKVVSTVSRFAKTFKFGQKFKDTSKLFSLCVSNNILSDSKRFKAQRR